MYVNSFRTWTEQHSTTLLPSQGCNTCCRFAMICAIKPYIQTSGPPTTPIAHPSPIKQLTLIQQTETSPDSEASVSDPESVHMLMSPNLS